MVEKISSKQFFKIMVVYIIANDLIRGIYAHDLHNDVWIPNLIGALISILLFTLYMFIYKNNKFDNFNNSMKHTLGKVLKNIIYGFYIIYFIALAFLNLVDIAESTLLHLLAGYNDFTIYLLLLVVILYILLMKVEVLGRLCEILFSGIIFIFITLVLLTITIHEFEAHNILPMLNDGIIEIVQPSIQMGYSLPFGELFALLIIFQYTDRKEQHTKTGSFGILTATFILVTITLLNIFIIGPYAMSYGISPAFRLARMIDIEEYVQRLDLLLIGFHMLLIFVKIIVLIYGAGHMIQNMFKLKEKQLKISYYIMIFVIFIATFFLTKNYTSVLLFRFDFFIKYISLIMEVFIPLVIVLLSFIRKGKKLIAPEQIIEYQI